MPIGLEITVGLQRPRITQVSETSDYTGVGLCRFHCCIFYRKYLYGLRHDFLLYSRLLFTHVRFNFGLYKNHV